MLSTFPNQLDNIDEQPKPKGFVNLIQIIFYRCRIAIVPIRALPTYFTQIINSYSKFTLFYHGSHGLIGRIPIRYLARYFNVPERALSHTRSIVKDLKIPTVRILW